MGTKLSQRRAAELCGISRQTLSNILDAADAGSSENVRGQTRRVSLKKISNGLGIPLDLIEREALADWGHIRTVDAQTVQEVYATIEGWHPDELAALGQNVNRILAEMATQRKDVPPKEAL